MRPDCPAGQTSLDGTCVSHQIADYVGCIRATGATVASDNSRSLSAAAGAVGVSSSTQAEVTEKLERRHAALSDTNTLQVIRDCSDRTTPNTSGGETGGADLPPAALHCFDYVFATVGPPGEMKGNECFASQAFWSNPESWTPTNQQLLAIDPCSERTETFCFEGNRTKGGPGTDWICRATLEFCQWTSQNGSTGCVRFASFPR